MEQVTWSQAQEIIQEGNYLLMFTTTWCPDCKMMKLLMKDIEAKYQGQNIRFLEINAEEANLFRDPSANWKVLKVPAFYTIKNNQAHFIGYEFIPAELIMENIDKIVE